MGDRSSAGSLGGMSMRTLSLVTVCLAAQFSMVLYANACTAYVPELCPYPGMTTLGLDIPLCA